MYLVSVTAWEGGKEGRGARKSRKKSQGKRWNGSKENERKEGRMGAHVCVMKENRDGQSREEWDKEEQKR